jgi:hypothetical protein
MRSFLAAMVAMLFASVASANPDGPVDVVVIQPSFQIGSGVVQPTGPVPPGGIDPPQADFKPWQFGLGILLPIQANTTLGFGYQHAKELSERVDIYQRSQTGEIFGHAMLGETNTLSVFVRFYLPLTQSAREGLGARP